MNQPIVVDSSRISPVPVVYPVDGDGCERRCGQCLVVDRRRQRQGVRDRRRAAAGAERGGCRCRCVVAGASSPVVEGLSAQDVFNALDADEDGLVTEAELRAAAEYRGIQPTEEQIAAFLAADADGYGVDVDEYLTSLDTTVLGPIVLDIYIYKTRVLNITLTEEQLKAIQEEAMRAMIEQQQGTLDRS